MAETNDTDALDDPAFQQEVFAEAFEETRRQFDGYKDVGTLDLLGHVMRGRNQAVDEIAHDFATDAGAECGAGCAFCCYQMVLCAPFEIFIIAKHLLDTRSAQEIGEIKQRLVGLAAVPLDAQHRTKADSPCALLDGNRCGIYDYRPSLCRTMLSTSRDACEAHLKTGLGTVPFIAEPVVIAFLMQLGIDYALIAKRFSTEKVELARALLIALNDFDKVFSGWLMGKDVFPDCQPDRQGPSNRELAENAARQCGLV